MIVEFLKLKLEICDADHKNNDRREIISKLVFGFVFFHVIINGI